MILQKHFMKNEKHTFGKEMRRFEYRYDLRTVFDDFLTMTICSFGINPQTGKSYDEDLYLATIDKYKKDPLNKDFPMLLALLVNEMTERLDSDTGWDVLGEFYEQNLQRKGLSQFFTPWHVCTLMARMTCEQAVANKEKGMPLRIIDPACGSGRMLLAASRVSGPHQHYFGIDLDYTCVKMTTLNLFLSGLFQTETLCGNALLLDGFHGSFTTSYLPFGLFRVKEKADSVLWHLMQDSIKPHKENAKLPPDFDNNPYSDGSQLTFF